MSLVFSTRRSCALGILRSRQASIADKSAPKFASPQRIRRFKSTSTGSGSNTSSGGAAAAGTAAATSKSIGAESASTKSAADKHAAFMQEANAQMKSYHEARELLRQGKLPNLNAHRGPKHANGAQAAVVVVFIVAFFVTPFIGKKIATDDEFRQKWIPAWYDFTVKKPEHAWTRQELHEQMLAVQREVRERAIAGDFTPEKLEAMQNAMVQSSASAASGTQQQAHRSNIDRSKIPKEWDMIHPGMDADEKLDESDN